MCFAPQRRALFRHLNFQKWSENGVLCTFWLGNVLHATTACTFSTSQLPKVVRTWCVLYIFTWKCASRHNGVQFFISPLASWLRTRRFSEPTFRPSGATNHWKNTVFRDFPTFSRICIFCLLTLSLLIFFLLIFLFSMPLPCSAFHLSILSEVWLLNFLRWVVYELCFWHKTPQNFRESYVKFYHRVFYYVMQTILSGPHWHNQARSRYTHLGPAGNFEGCWGYCNGPMACHLENTLSLHGIPLKTNGATSAAGHWVPYHHSASPLAT